MTIKSANELKENLKSVDKLLISKEYKSIIRKWIKNKAKAQLEKLGCEKRKMIDGNYHFCNCKCRVCKDWLCPKCNEEKEILEGILK